MNSFDIEMDPFEIWLEGEEGPRMVASRAFTLIGNVVLRRIISLINYVGPKQFNPAINKIIELFPDEIDVPGTSIFTQGGIAKYFSISEDDHMAISFDLSVQDREHPLNKENTAVFSSNDIPNDF